MRSRHYLTTQCLDAPYASGWMALYEYGTDINFLNATSLTRAFDQLLYGKNLRVQQPSNADLQNAILS
ncbi:hypothetical protein PF010_g25396 [Phytophthora fragariae]|uniref:Uncharacterized protein n=1 Tax=Phytophthora fragariae TaxID=53985 RepID=A0A6G0JZT3_9STRA|nr:hypothetical protein PF010_g25396 [Phytophthora fragariae]